jgi:hypothetical protein
MSDFFLRLAARSLDSTPVALPRIASRYATPGWDRSPQVDTQFAAGRTGTATTAPGLSPRDRIGRRGGDASRPPTGMHHDGPATSSPSARTSSPSMPRTRREEPVVPRRHRSRRHPVHTPGWTLLKAGARLRRLTPSDPGSSPAPRLPPSPPQIKLTDPPRRMDRLHQPGKPARRPLRRRMRLGPGTMQRTRRAILCA